MKTVQKNGIAEESELFDIKDVAINKDLPREEQIQEYLKQIKNPNRFRCGDVVVEVEYGTKGVSINTILSNEVYLGHLIQGRYKFLKVLAVTFSNILGGEGYAKNKQKNDSQGNSFRFQ